MQRTANKPGQIFHLLYIKYLVSGIYRYWNSVCPRKKTICADAFQTQTAAAQKHRPAPASLSSGGQAPGPAPHSCSSSPPRLDEYNEEQKGFWRFHSSKSLGADSEVRTSCLLAKINSNFHGYCDPHNPSFKNSTTKQKMQFLRPKM